MTRKDFILIADAIRHTHDRITTDDLGLGEAALAHAAIDSAARELADALAASNPRFERDRFIRWASV